MEHRTRGSISIAFLRILVIGVGIAVQRMALGVEIAMPPQSVALPAGKTSVNGEQLAQVQIAQVLPIISNDAPAEHDTSTTGSSTEPQAGTQEIISIARQPNPAQRRRRPKMAGVPSGSQVVAETPESAPATQQAETNKSEVPTAKNDVAAQPAVSQAADNAQSDTIENEETLDTGIDYSPGAIARRQAERDQGIGRQYQMAPIKWGGRVFEMVAIRRSRNWNNLGPTSSLTGPITLTPRPSIFYHLQGVQTQAKTYVLAPWVAAITGRLGVVGENLRPLTGDKNNTHDTRITGGGDLALFSQSRFPFSMNLDVLDSRTENQLLDSNANLDSVSKTLSMTQEYQPLRGPSHYAFNYNYNHTDYKDLLSYNNQNQMVQLNRQFATTYSILSGSYRTLFGKNLDQPFNLNGSHSTSSNSVYPEGGLTRDSITASHLYLPEDSLLTLKSLGRFFETRQIGRTSRNLQLSTQATWQPEDLDNPLIVHGGVSFFSAQNQVAATYSDVKSLNTNVYGTYNKWAHLTLLGGGSLTATNANGTSSLFATQYGSARYSPGTIHLNGGKLYSRSAYAGFSNQMPAGAPSNFSTFANANHSLTSPFDLGLFGYNTRLSTKLGQSIGIQSNRLTGVNETLDHTGAVTWVPLGLRQKLPGTRTRVKGLKAGSSGAANLISSVTFSARDSRTFGAHPRHSQSFRLGAGAGAGGAYSAAGSGYGGSADMSIEMTRTTTGASTGGITGKASWGHRFIYSYSYRKAKVFDVKGLNYALRFNASIDPELRTRMKQNFQSSQSIADSAQYIGYGASLVQSLQYRVGLNEALLTASLENSYGFYTASLFLRFRAWRNFGN